MNAITLKEAKKELKQQPKEKERIIREYTTGEGELIGEVFVWEPNKKLYKKGMYKANILLSEEEGKQLTKELEQMLHKQYVEQGEGTQLTPITTILEPYTTDNKSHKGKYILRTQAHSQIWEGEDIMKPYTRVINEEIRKGMAEHGWGIMLKEGSIVQLAIRFEAYTTSYTTGVLALLRGVEVINPSTLYKCQWQKVN